MQTDKILRKPNIWDLHIHTPLGTPTEKFYDGASTEEFVDEIIEIYRNLDNKIGMISFTDHNKINAEAYHLFCKKSDIAIIPGVEMDIYLTEKEQNSKHIIFYFDEKELENIDELKDIIEAYVDENEKVVFEDFVLRALQNKRFAIAPHAFKQKKRGIDYEWADEFSASRGTREFTGLFFPFWEAAGKSDICKAIEFLNEQSVFRANEQAIIAFSDSSSYMEIKNYAENPHQYFLCLNSFKGLLLLGSEKSRIIYEYKDWPQENPSEKIKRIKFSSNLKKVKGNNQIEVELSDRLNVIIGGRGKGKSALLDAIVYSIDEMKIKDKKRADFVKKFNVQATNFNETSFTSDTNIVYISQSFINKLFDGNSQETLSSFFDKQFSEKDTLSYGISDIKTIFEADNEPVGIEELNVVDDLQNLICIKEKKKGLSIKPVQENDNIPLLYKGEGYDSYIKNTILDYEDIWDKKLNNLFQEFTRQLLVNIALYNYKNLFTNKFPVMIQEEMDIQERKKSDQAERRGKSKDRISRKLESLYFKELKRIRQINKLYEISKRKTGIQFCYSPYLGEGDNRFFFVSVANKEHPVEFAKRIIIESVDKRRFDKKSVFEIFKEYATTDDISKAMKETVSFQDLVQKISDFDGLKSDKVQKMIHKNENEYIDLHKASPGTQTNSVMEYILHTDSTVPLFIDQPEDNIDNEARYYRLTKWIKTQKNKRQIILVTHDANIVMNGDAECVIIANHTGEKFSYEYGALEYGNILDEAAVILDGGKTAIRRRIEKYGE